MPHQLEVFGKRPLFGFVIGLVLFVGILVAPAPPGLKPAAQKMAAVVVLMALWWWVVRKDSASSWSEVRGPRIV